MTIKYCPICKVVPLERISIGDVFVYRCPNCGMYYQQWYGKLSPPMSHPPKGFLEQLNPPEKPLEKGISAFTKFLTEVYGLPMGEYRKLSESKKEKVRELYREWLKRQGRKRREELEEEKEELSPVDKQWMNNVAQRLSRNSEKWKKEIYKHLYLMLMGQEEYWDSVQWIRSISGYHIEDIHKVMREEMNKLPELKREIRRQGVVLPFEKEYVLEMTRKQKKKTKKHAIV